MQGQLIARRAFGVILLLVLAAISALSNGQRRPLQISAYASGSSDTAALRIISGTRTGLGHPAGLALDGASDVYVSNKANNSVTVFARGVRGNVAPRRMIAARAPDSIIPEMSS